MRIRKNVVGFVILSLLGLMSAKASEAQVLHFFEMAVDADNSDATGCDFVVTDAGLPGVADPGYEILLTLTVDSGQTPPMVIAADRSDCNTGSGSFEFVSSLPGAPWPVGLNNGTAGSDVVEGFLPLTFTTADEIRLAFRSLSDSGSEDALISTGGSSADPPILIPLASLVEIPTLSTLGLVLLVMVLAALGLGLLRRRRSSLLMTLVILLSLASLIYAAIPDGMVDEWAGSAPVATDPVPDSLPMNAAAEIVAAFLEVNGGDLCVRLDIADLENAPIKALDDLATVDEDVVSAIIDVLANDLDPDPGDSLTIIQVDSPTVAGGTAVIDPLATPDNRILYTPPADFNGPDSFTYTVEESGGGLTDMAMVSVTVDPVNDAPVLDNSGAMIFTAIDEDAATPMGDPVFALIASAGGDRITDVDSGAVEGVAVIGRDNSNGTWEFSTNGGGLWTPFGALGAASATVLSATPEDRIRFVPAADFAGSVDPGITFRAWDTTSGEPTGMTGVDTTTNGGTTAFSTATETASIGVNPINDPPVKTAGGGGPVAFTEDGGPVAVDPAVTVTDIDSPNLATATVTVTNLLDSGMEILAATASGAIGAGDITYVAPTLTIAPVGGAPIADFQAVLQSVTYDNSSQDPDTTARVLNCVANDGAANSNTLAQTVTVAAENDAPVLDNTGTMAFTAIDEDVTGPTGDLVSGLIATGGGDPITDVDSGAVEGIAVTGRDNTNGTWEFSTNGGGAWTPFGALSDANATVLSDTAMDRIRFVPAANFNGSVDPGITFRAWDTTSGQASGTAGVDASTNGGSTAFSTATETASIIINALNDPPVKTSGGGGPAAFTEGLGPVVIDAGITVTDVDNANLVSATVTLTNLLDAGVEVLAATPSGAIGAGAISYAAPILTIAPVGGAPVADFQAVLRTVTYNNTSTSPNETNRILNCVANDGAANSNVVAQTVTVTGVNAPPTAGTDNYDTLGNTELTVGTGGPAAVSLATVALPGVSVLDNDSDPEATAVMVVSATGVATDSMGPTFDVVTTNGGAVSMDMAGRFTYLPPRGVSNMADAFTYGIQDADGVGATGTVNITIANARIWYVHNDPAGEPLNPVDGANFGRSDDPFDLLAAASAAHGAGDLICVYRGDGSTTGMNAGITLAASNVTLHGEHQGCSVNLSLNGQAAPEVLLAPTANSHARLGHTAGNAISVNATAGNVTGISIRGVDLSSTGGNGLDVTTSGANNVGVVFENSLVAGASTEGIDVNHASSGLATVQVNNLSSLVASGNGFDARTTGTGDLEVSFDDVAGITSAAGAGSAVFMEDVSGAGTLFVTSFSESTVLGTSAGDGVQILGAVFDADPSDADFDQVSAGDLNIGLVSNRVGRSGLILGTAASRVSGNLSFGTLNAFTTNGPALFASGSAVSVGGPPPTAGFLLTIATGIADAIGGPAVSLDPLTANVQLSSVSSTGSPLSGVSLVDVAGTVTLQGGGLVNSAGATFLVMGGTVTASYSGGITQANNAPAVTVSGGHSTGIVTFDTGTVSATNGTGLQFDNADGTYNFNGTTTLNGGDAGVDILNGSAGTFNFGANAAITHAGAGTGFNVNGSSPTLDYDGTINDSSGLAVDINSFGAGGSARFDGQVTSSGAGLRIGGAASTVLFANADLTSSATVDIDTNLAVITFSDLSLNQTAGAVNAFDVNGGSANIVVNLTGSGIRSSTGNRLVDITGRAGGTVSFNGAATVQGTGGNTGINITGSTAANTVAFNSPVDAGLSGNRLTGGTGVNIDNNGQAGAVVSFANLDVFTSGQTALRAVNSGMANVTTGSLNALTGQGVEVDGVDTGMTFSSLTTTSSGAEGVQLTNLRDGASFAITGATSVTGASTRGISISSAVGAAIDLDFTGATTVDNAGAEGIRVDRADTNGDPTASDIDFGAVNINNRNNTGIFLDNVEGTFDAGVTNIANPNSASGYGIRMEDSSALATFSTANISDTNQGTATTDGGGGVPGNDGDGDAIFLKDNTGGFTLNGGLLEDLATDGIDIRNSGNVTLSGVTIEDIGTASTNPTTIPDSGLFINNLRGTNLIRNSLIQRAQTDDIDELIRMLNNGQTYEELRINNTDFINTTIGAVGVIRAANGVRIENRGAMDGTVIIENGSDFTGIRLNAIALLNGDGSGAGSGTIHVVVDNAVLTGPAPVISGGVIQVGGGNDVAIGIQDDYTVHYNVMNTTLQDIQVGGTLAGVMSSVTGDVSTGGPGPSVTGRWIGNTIDDIRGRRAFNLITEGDNQAYSVTIADNSIQDLRAETISGAAFFAREAIAIATRDDTTNRLVRIVNNSVGAGPDGVIQSTGGTVAGDDLPVADGSSREALDFLVEDNSILTALVHNNAFLVGAGGSEAIEIDVENSTTLNLTLTDNDIAAELDVNSTAEELFLIDTEAATATARLDLDNNTATLSGQEWEIDEDTGPITIENRATVTARNTGSFNFMDTIDDNGGDVARPGAVILAQSGRISQIATVSTAFAALEVRILDSNGEAEAGVTVSFAAPGAGASGTFPGGATCVTNASGICSVAFTANATPGAFRVMATATVEGSAGEPAIFYLRNLP